MMKIMSLMCNKTIYFVLMSVTYKPHVDSVQTFLTVVVTSYNVGISSENK